MDHRQFAWDFVADWYVGDQRAAFRRLMALGRWDLVLALDAIRDEADDLCWSGLKHAIEKRAEVARRKYMTEDD